MRRSMVLMCCPVVALGALPSAPAGATKQRIAARDYAPRPAAAPHLARAVPRRPPVLIIRGAGFGHGVGMSQFGARGLALRGLSHHRILRHYYTGTRLGRAASGRSIRVLLQAGVRSVSFRWATRAGSRRVRPAVSYVLEVRDDHLRLRTGSGRELARLRAPLRISGPDGVTLSGVAINGLDFGRYRGALEVLPAGSGRLDVVNEVGLEDYVAGVLAAEMPSRWPMEALKAQAVAARTYAITTRVGGAVFDQWPDTRSQVYRGVAAETERALRAVRATRGEVVTYRGRPATTYFFSSSGGLTEDSRHVFGAARPWLRSRRDPYESASPRHRWTIRMSPAAAGARLRGLVRGRFRGIRVLRRGHSPRVVRAEIVGTDGVTPVSGATLRARLGLPDTWAYFAVVG